jgi:natural product biosynthesis luciferase-like monooxygenase protein
MEMARGILSRPIFSLLFFASRQAAADTDKFDLFRRSTRFADARGFEAVWIPERHFHAFGGIFPNPSLAGAVLAEITRRIRIRAGSVVMPLHHPVRVAEEWAVVDNLSGGRVDVSFAIGWNPDDFALAPERYAERKTIAYAGIAAVQRMWRGEPFATVNGAGAPIAVTIHPLPIQPELNVWLTCSGDADRFAEAGAMGLNVLTALLFQTVDELAEKLAAYRTARARHGHDGPGHVTLMLHTFVGSDERVVKEIVRAPFKEYLASSADLWRAGESRLRDLSPRKRADMLEYAFERYYQRTALMGTPDSCRRLVEAVTAAGVDEIACLIDFGLPSSVVLEGLEELDTLRRGSAVRSR